MGLVLGLIAAGLLFATGNVLPVPSHPPAMYDVQAIPTGELGFARQRPLIGVRNLRPGTTSAGSYGATELSNLTGKPMRVQMRLVTAGHDLDRIVRAKLMLGSQTMAMGTLVQLRSWTRSDPVLPVGGHKPLRMMVWMPEGDDVRFEGLAANSRLELRAHAAVQR